MKHFRRVDGLIVVMLVVLLSSGCVDRRASREEAPPDSAALMRRSDSADAAAVERRLSALKEASAKGLLSRGRLGSDLIVERPTVMAFFPFTEAERDRVTLRERLGEYEEIARAAGWTFAERYTAFIQNITDPASQALYSLSLPRDSIGLVLAAPGYRPQVWFGHISGAALRGRLEGFGALRGKEKLRTAEL